MVTLDEPRSCVSFSYLHEFNWIKILSHFVKETYSID